MTSLPSTNKQRRFYLYLLSLSVAVFFAAALSLVVGSSQIPLAEIKNALFAFDAENIQHLIIRELRIPRTIGDMAIGAALAAAGALMQGMSRNPLADSGLLGINGGAAFALSVYFAFFTALHYSLILVFSLTGAAVALAIVYGVAGLRRRKLTPVRLVMTGSAVNIFLTSLSQAVAMYFKVGQEITFWTAGGVAGIRLEQLQVVLPVLGLGLVGALLLARPISLLNLGEDTAQGLGLNVKQSRVLCMLVVLMLAGSSVALAGPIAFVGLVLPHLAALFVGADYRRIIPTSILLGSLFMLLADVLSRILNPPQETPIGLMFALLGVPFFIYTLRKSGRGTID